MNITVTTNFDMFDDGKKHRIQQNSVAKSKGKEDITPAKTDHKTSQTKEDNFSFWDMVDVINPMQHLPIIGNIYREITGDGIQPIARIAGGAIFGGIIGAASSIANVIVQETSGKDIGEHMMAMVIDETKEPPLAGPQIPQTQMASNGDITQPLEKQRIEIIKQGHKEVDDTLFNTINANNKNSENPSENPYAVLAQARINTPFNGETPVINIRGRHFIDHEGNRVSSNITNNILSKTISDETHLALLMLQNHDNS